MSPQVPVGFPFDLTDSELAAQLDVLSTNLANGGINESLRWGPLVQLGLNEQQNRETKKSNMLSRRVGNIALFVSFVSLIFTVFAAYYAREASTSSDRGKKRRPSVSMPYAAIWERCTRPWRL